jgi:hypothetical protein
MWGNARKEYKSAGTFSLSSLHYYQLISSDANDFKQIKNDYEYFGCYYYNKSQQDALFLNFILVKNYTCFGQNYCPSSGVLILYSQQLVFVIVVAVNTVLRLLMMESKSVRNMYSSLPK